MMWNKVAPTPEHATSKTWVWWDMDGCPVPNGYDPRLVGPRIDTELKNLGYNGPLTIVAVGNLSWTPYEFLEALSSTGVVIKHAPSGMLEDVLMCKSLRQTPTTIMLIAEFTLLETLACEYRARKGYNLLLAYPPNTLPGEEGAYPSSVLVSGEWLWDRSSLLKDSGPVSGETRREDKGSEVLFSCGSCHELEFPTFDGFKRHLQSRSHAKKLEIDNEETPLFEAWKNKRKGVPEYATSKTLVWWDMDNCPLPNGYDPRRLGPRIDTELKNLGYNGPLTIIAASNLSGIPYEFLEALSSTGVVIKHVPSGMSDYVLSCESHEQVTMMLISHPDLLEFLTSKFWARRSRCNFLLAYPPHCPPALSSELWDIQSGCKFLLANPPRSAPHDPDRTSLLVSGDWLWDRTSLLKDSGSVSGETRRVDKGSEMFSCQSCVLDFPTFDGFTTHLQSSLHARKIESDNREREKMFKLASEKYEALKLSKVYRDLAREKDLGIKELAEFRLPEIHHTAKAKKKQSKAKSLKIEEEVESFLPKIATAKAKKLSKASKKVEKIEDDFLPENATAKAKKQIKGQKVEDSRSVNGSLL